MGPRNGFCHSSSVVDAFFPLPALPDGRPSFYVVEHFLELREFTGWSGVGGWVTPSGELLEVTSEPCSVRPYDTYKGQVRGFLRDVGPTGISMGGQWWKSRVCGL